MMALRMPFKGRDLPSLLRRIRTESPQPLPRRFPQEAHQLVSSLLRKSPSVRVPAWGKHNTPNR